MASVKSYKHHYFESSASRTPDYIAFENACRRELKKQCVGYGIAVHSFHPNHFEWSAVLEKGGKFIYVSISDVRFWNRWYDEVLIRTMAHDKDWRGGINNHCSFDKIGETANKMFNS